MVESGGWLRARGESEEGGGAAIEGGGELDHRSHPCGSYDEEWR